METINIFLFEKETQKYIVGINMQYKNIIVNDDKFI